MTYRNQCRGRRFRTESYRRRLRLNERIEAARARFAADGYYISPLLEFDIMCKEALPHEEIRAFMYAPASGWPFGPHQPPPPPNNASKRLRLQRRAKRVVPVRA